MNDVKCPSMEKKNEKMSHLQCPTLVKNERNPVIQNDIEETQRFYNKQNKPGAKRQKVP